MLTWSNHLQAMRQYSNGVPPRVKRGFVCQTITPKSQSTYNTPLILNEIFRYSTRNNFTMRSRLSSTNYGNRSQGTSMKFPTNIQNEWIIFRCRK